MLETKSHTCREAGAVYLFRERESATVQRGGDEALVIERMWLGRSSSPGSTLQPLPEPGEWSKLDFFAPGKISIPSLSIFHQNTTMADQGMSKCPQLDMKQHSDRIQKQFKPTSISASGTPWASGLPSQSQSPATGAALTALQSAIGSLVL